MRTRAITTANWFSLLLLLVTLGKHIQFRRVILPGDNKDKQRRLTEAVEALSALESVKQYHASLSDPVQFVQLKSE